MTRREIFLRAARELDGTVPGRVVRSIADTLWERGAIAARAEVCASVAGRWQREVLFSALHDATEVTP